jgi:hypothetical protein
VSTDKLTIGTSSDDLVYINDKELFGDCFEIILRGPDGSEMYVKVEHDKGWKFTLEGTPIAFRRIPWRGDPEEWENV